MANRPGETVRFTTPPAVELYAKTVRITRTDTTAFDAFVLPKGAVIAGAYVLGLTASDAATTATLDVGSNPGTTNEILAGYNVRTIGSGSATYDPGSLADGAGATTTVTVTGAKLGDYVEAAFSLDLQGITLTAWVSAADTVSVRFQNESGGVLDLASGTLTARVSTIAGGGVGYNPALTQAGTSMGSQLTVDTLIKAKYTETGTASTTGGPWLVKVEYYFPQPGNSW